MIRLELVEYHMQKLQVKRIIEKHHSYVPSNRSVGRRIDWLIYHSDYKNDPLVSELARTVNIPINQIATIIGS